MKNVRRNNQTLAQFWVLLVSVLACSCVGSMDEGERSLVCESGEECPPGAVCWDGLCIETVDFGPEDTSLIIGSLDWFSPSTLALDHPMRIKARAVAELGIIFQLHVDHADGSTRNYLLRGRCTGALVSEDMLLTNHHCVNVTLTISQLNDLLRASGYRGDAIRYADSLFSLDAYFRNEEGVPDDEREEARYVCDDLITESAEYDVAALSCEPREGVLPGEVFGYLRVEEDAFVVEDQEIYLIHQNCNYYEDPACEEVKLVSPGTILDAGPLRDPRHAFIHDADTLGGSSGAPVLEASSHLMIGLHFAGEPSGDEPGHGVHNYAMPMSAIIRNVAGLCIDPDGDGVGVGAGCGDPVEVCNGVDDTGEGDIDEGCDDDGDDWCDAAYEVVGFPPTCPMGGGDCDDGEPRVNPGMREEFCDGLDNDCSRLTEDAPDSDLDGWNVCSDCDDDNRDIYPGAAERCNDIDDNCDGRVDEGLSFDEDGDGHLRCDSCDLEVGEPCDCDDRNHSVYPAAPELCDNLDNNCNGEIDEGLSTDSDHDGYTTPESCQGTRDDCNDRDEQVFPGAPERCNGIDDDCDGSVDEGLATDSDGDGYSTPGSRCGTRDDCDDSDPEVHPGAPERCNAIDDNCDGTVDEGCWYFAEGSTRDTMSPWFTIMNPTDRDTDVTVTYLFEDGSTRDQSLRVEAHSRGTVDVRGFLGVGYDFSAVVSAPGADIVVERSMYGGDPWTWAHNSVGATSLARTWYFAEGATFESMSPWILVMNPSDHDVDVTITYMFPDGATQDQRITVRAHGRGTANVRAEIGADREFSARVRAEAGERIVAERAMYGGDPWTWAHNSFGATAEAGTWYFAEGSTRESMSPWITIMNPSGSEAHVTITYMFPDGGNFDRHITMRPHSRATANVRADVGPGRDVSAKVTADRGIVAERSMYGGEPAVWAHNTMGATSPARTWYFGEGSTRESMSPWITILNPSGSEARVTITYMFSDGRTQDRALHVAAHSRATAEVRADVGPGHDVSARVSADRGIVVERPMYGGDPWSWAHCSMGHSR